MIEISHLPLWLSGNQRPTGHLRTSPVVLSPGEGHPQHSRWLAGSHHGGVLKGWLLTGGLTRGWNIQKSSNYLWSLALGKSSNYWWSLAPKKSSNYCCTVCEMLSFWSWFSYGNHGPLRICRNWNASCSRATWNYQRLTTIPGWKVPSQMKV